MIQYDCLSFRNCFEIFTETIGETLITVPAQHPLSAGYEKGMVFL